MILELDEKATKEKEGAEHRQKILQQFKQEKGEAQDYWDPIYTECKKHVRFTLLGKQFEDGQAQKFGFGTNAKEPNMLITYLNHEANTTLQIDYRAKITPNGGGANDVEARAREEVLRGLQRMQSIEQILNQARRMQCAGGIYYVITTTPYAGKRGQMKTILHEGLEQTFNCYPDPYVKTCTFADAKRWFVKKDVPKAEWTAETGLDTGGWAGKKTKELWYYMVREDSEDKEYLREDGSAVLESELEKPEGSDELDLEGMMTDEQGPIYRDVSSATWCWYKIADDKVIDEEVLAGSESPITACTGRKVVDGDKVFYQPLTQFAEEAQLIYTILENIICLRLARSPYSKWKVAFESVLGGQDLQTLRDSAMFGETDIVYKSKDAKGEPIPQPEEVEADVLNPILIELQREQKVKMQNIFGIFDANLGNKSNEQSGVAIEARKRGGEVSNYDLTFNFLEFVEQLGRNTLDLIPRVLTPEQQARYVDQTDKEVLDWIAVNGASVPPDGEEYSLSIDASPTATTARQEEAEQLGMLAAKNPLIANNPRAMAIVIAAQPGRHSQELANIIAGNDPEKEQMKGQLQELQGQLQQVTVEASKKVDQLQQTITFMKQQQALMKQSFAAMGQNAEDDAVYKQFDAQIQLMEAETKQKQADTERIKVLGDVHAKHTQQGPAMSEAA